jgi:hypothetical protein
LVCLGQFGSGRSAKSLWTVGLRLKTNGRKQLPYSNQSNSLTQHVDHPKVAHRICKRPTWTRAAAEKTSVRRLHKILNRRSKEGLAVREV